jgi:hypothetical protein
MPRSLAVYRVLNKTDLYAVCLIDIINILQTCESLQAFMYRQTIFTDKMYLEDNIENLEC